MVSAGTIDASNGINTKPAQYAAGHQHTCDPGADDMPDAHVFRRDLPTDLGRWKEFIGLFGDPAGFPRSHTVFSEEMAYKKPHPGPKGRAGKIAAFSPALSTS